jgi:hypothetical protein
LLFQFYGGECDGAARDPDNALPLIGLPEPITCEGFGLGVVRALPPRVRLRMAYPATLRAPHMAPAQFSNAGGANPAPLTHYAGLRTHCVMLRLDGAM